MAALQLTVLQCDRSWAVLRDGRWPHRFDTREAAIQRAWTVAHRANRAGIETEMLIQDEGGELHRTAPRAVS